MVYYFWKGRVALYTFLQAIGIGVEKTDEVILPGFSCVVVPNAILYSGATPIYADIDPCTYNITAQSINPLITDNTRAIIVQNTFGLSPDLDPIVGLARENEIIVIEDCAHGLGAKYKGRPAGINTDAAFFSTQWSKPVSTGLGGMAYVSKGELAENVSKLVQELPAPSFAVQLMLLAQWFIRPFADHPALHYNLLGIYRWLTQKIGLSVGSSVGCELNSIQMPPDYLMGMGSLQKWLLGKELKKLDVIVHRRQQMAHYYDGYFSKTSLAIPDRPDYATHAMLRYPIRVSNKAELLKKARRLHIPIGDWFVSPLHPVEGDLSLWGYQRGQCPEAEKACAEVINLFTDYPLTYKQLSTLFP